MKLTALLGAAFLSLGLLVSTSSAQIKGKVTLDGEAPLPEAIEMAADPKCAALHKDPVLKEDLVVGDAGELANVVVSIQPPEGKELKGELPKEPAVLDQKGCQYVPHVIGMMVGQELIVKNSDDFMHNVHGQPFDNDQFNISQPRKDPQGKKLGNKIKTAERFSIKCDVHPWMLVHVNAFDHPFFAVSDAKGEFSIPTKGLEDGKYTLEIWHEKLAPDAAITQEIEVKDGKATVEEIKVPMAAPAAQADDVKADVKLASAAEQKACKESGGACCAAKSKAQAIASAAKAK